MITPGLWHPNGHPSLEDGDDCNLWMALDILVSVLIDKKLAQYLSSLTALADPK